jgi:hypothetical protein
MIKGKPLGLVSATIFQPGLNQLVKIVDDIHEEVNRNKDCHGSHGKILTNGAKQASS